MSQSEQAPVSYLRAVREVIPSQDIRAFLARADRLSGMVFGYSASQSLRVPVSTEEALHDDYAPQYEGVGVPEAPVFAMNGLRVVLFERRARASLHVNEVLSRAGNRITAPRIRSSSRPRHSETGGKVTLTRPNTLPAELAVAQEGRGFGEGKLRAHILGVVDSTRVDVFSGIEYSLEIDPTSTPAQILLDQSGIIKKNVQSTVAGKPLFGSDIVFESERSPLHIPFLQIPGHVVGRDPAACERFLDNVQRRAEFDIEFAPVEWNQKLRSTV